MCANGLTAIGVKNWNGGTDVGKPKTQDPGLGMQPVNRWDDDEYDYIYIF